ncbi:MAG: hypothetical protein ACE5G1_10005 [bacterium]
MIDKDRVQWVIEQHYRSIDRHYNQRVTTKSWCLTVWILVLIFIGINRTILLNYQGMILTMLPVVMFWIIEGMQASHMKIMELRVAELEKLWAANESQVKNSTELLFYGSHQYQSSRIKFNLFVYALFKMETVFSFYLLLAILNSLVALLFMVTLPL